MQPWNLNVLDSLSCFLGATAGLGGLLFGFDLAIIVGAAPFLIERFQLSNLSLDWAFS
jgi:hypothetical protein